MVVKNRLPRVLIICAARIPSVEIGVIIPFSELQKKHLCISKYKDELFLSIDDIEWCDILFIVRGTSSKSVWAAKQAKKFGRLVLGYWDDDLSNVPEHNINYAHYSSPEVKNNIDNIFHLTDTFFFANSRLANKISSIHSINTKLVPGVLGSKVLRTPVFRNNDPPIIGFAGSIVYVNILESLIGPALIDLASKSKFRIHTIAAKPNFISKIPVKTTYTQRISNYVDYLDYSSKLKWDIGLAPQENDEFANCKFYNKLMEYTYIGCAGIYSKIELYTSVIEDGVTGLLVENEIDAWKNAILRLLKDPDLRYKIADNAYEFVQSHHGIQAVTEQYTAALSPFLDYRAPEISKSQKQIAKGIDEFKLSYKNSAMYIRNNGIRRFLITATVFVFSSVKRKFSSYD